MSLLLAGMVASALAASVELPEGLDAAYAPRRVALVVGIDEYDDYALTGLKFPAKDARDMGAVLQDTSAGDFDTVRVLAGEVDADAFWGAFHEVTSDLERDDLFVLFLAGHGTLGPLGNDSSALYFLPSDTVLERYDRTGIAMQDIENALRAIAPRRRVLMLDACHSGTGRSTLSSQVLGWISALRGPAPDPLVPRFAKFDARMYAADIRQPAREDDALQNGVYTHFLVEGLSGAADLDGDGLVSVQELHEHVAARTMRHTGGAQVPRIETSEVGAGALFLAGDPADRVEAENAILTGLSGLPEGVVVQVDGAERGAILTPGRHRVTLSDGNHPVMDTPVYFRAGRATDIRRLLRDRGARWNLGVGGGWTPSEWTPAVVGELDLQFEPRDKGGGRPVVALALSGGTGEVDELGEVGAIRSVASVGWRLGGAVGHGPVVGGGALVRQLGPYGQGGPLIALGWRVDWQGSFGFVALKPELHTAPTTSGLTWLPSVTFVVGPSAR
jgi:uncharacterized caspase-like protein